MLIRAIHPSAVKDRPESYNSSSHDGPSATELFGPIPSKTPYSFSRWLPLIATSQGPPRDSVQRFQLSRSQAQLILSAGDNLASNRKLKNDYINILAQEMSLAFSNFELPLEGLSLLLDTCIVDDGFQREAPIHSLPALIFQLCTSQKAIDAILEILNNGEAFVGCFLLPSNDRITKERNYRVFCPPVDPHNISAISQYRWDEPWKLERNCRRDKRSPDLRSCGDDPELPKCVGTICKEIHKVHMEIMAAVDRGIEAGNPLDQLVLQQGFTFDVCYDEFLERASLIQLNPFGGSSGCGSCLFHWVSDKELLYGSTHKEFRIAACLSDSAISDSVFS